MEATVGRHAPVLAVTVRGREIVLTAEHPFFTMRAGWVEARLLVPGDLVRGLGADEWAEVQAVGAAAGEAVVYNLTVRDAHTYFVGDAGWGFAVWIHNAAWCEEAMRAGATRRVQTAGDITFKSKAEAQAYAAKLHGSHPSSPQEVQQIYGKNPNMRGPKGEPYERITVLDNDGNQIQIDHHSSGHYFKDVNSTNCRIIMALTENIFHMRESDILARIASVKMSPKDRVRAKLLADPAPSEWGNWIISPAPDYLEIHGYGPFTVRETEWVEVQCNSEHGDSSIIRFIVVDNSRSEN